MSHAVAPAPRFLTHMKQFAKPHSVDNCGALSQKGVSLAQSRSPNVQGIVLTVPGPALTHAQRNDAVSTQPASELLHGANDANEKFPRRPRMAAPGRSETHAM